MCSISVLYGCYFTDSDLHTLVVPVVNVTADRTRVGPGGAATLTCTVTRGNPMTYTYSWTHVGAALLGETSATLSLTSFSMDAVGTYTCEVVNDAGSGMGSITIELGGETSIHSVVRVCVSLYQFHTEWGRGGVFTPKHEPPPQLTFSSNFPSSVIPVVTARVSPSRPVIEGSTVDLVCEAPAGDLPISYSWTGPSGQDVSLADTDGTISVTISASGDYGTYTCAATNEIGMGNAADVEVVQAGN